MIKKIGTGRDKPACPLAGLERHQVIPQSLHLSLVIMLGTLTSGVKTRHLL